MPAGGGGASRPPDTLRIRRQAREGGSCRPRPGVCRTFCLLGGEPGPRGWLTHAHTPPGQGDAPAPLVWKKGMSMFKRPFIQLGLGGGRAVGGGRSFRDFCAARSKGQCSAFCRRHVKRWRTRARCISSESRRLCATRPAAAFVLVGSNVRLDEEELTSVETGAASGRVMSAFLRLFYLQVRLVKCSSACILDKLSIGSGYVLRSSRH